MATLTEQISNLFGFQIKRPDPEQNIQAFAPKADDDGAVTVAAGGSYGTYVDLDGTVRTEAELINRYRDMSLYPEVDAAIDDITNETIVTEEGEKTVELVLDDLPGLTPKLKQILSYEFEEVLRLLEFNTKSYDVFRRYYIDGRLYYHAIIDKTQPNLGLKELRYLDPRKIRKIREIVKKRDLDNPQITVPKTVAEYYVYSEKSLATGNKSLVPQASTTGIKIAKDSIIHVTSGLMDTEGKMVLSYLHKAIKPLNQLRALEDATIIYRISRAPERRIFYIDVGNLPKLKAEQYLRDMMIKHRNRLVYDHTTGEIKDDRKFMTMLEDYWLPRREGNRGTEISTLPAGQNLGELSDVNYFQNKLYKSLNVPISRLDPQYTFTLGKATEITRDEIKFNKFIERIRLRFSKLFLSVLEKQVILKQIMAPEEWDQIQSELKFKFLRDNYFAEVKDSQIMMGRMEILTQMDMFVGKYYSHEYVRRHVLRQNDKDIQEIDAQIAQEMTNPQYFPPIDAMSPTNEEEQIDYEDYEPIQEVITEEDEETSILEQEDLAANIDLKRSVVKYLNEK